MKIPFTDEGARNHYNYTREELEAAAKGPPFQAPDLPDLVMPHLRRYSAETNEMHARRIREMLAMWENCGASRETIVDHVGRMAEAFDEMAKASRKP